MSDTPRTSIPARIEALGLPQAKTYVDFIRQGDEGGPLPCWGAIAARFDQLFKSDEHRQALWSVLVEEGDRRPLLLFMHLSRGQPAVMSKVAEDAGQLPVSLQRALVSMEEVEALIPDHLASLHPSARQLWEAGTEVRAREREIFESKVSELLSFQYYVPEQQVPPQELTGGGTMNLVDAGGS